MHRIAVAQSRDWDRTLSTPYRQWSSRSESHSPRPPKIVRLGNSSPVRYGKRPFYSGNDKRRREWFDPHQPPPPPPLSPHRRPSPKPVPFQPNPVHPPDLYRHHHIKHSPAIPRNRHYHRVERFSPPPSQPPFHETENETKDARREPEVPEVPPAPEDYLSDDQQAYAVSVPDQEEKWGANLGNSGQLLRLR